MKTILLCLLFSLVLINAQPLVVPYPQSLTSGTGSLPVNPNAFTITSNVNSMVLDVSIKRYQGLLFPFPTATTNSPQLTLNVVVQSTDENLALFVDESYGLLITSSGSLTLTANTIYGAMRGLETFSQLFSYDPATQLFSIPFVPINIQDAPRYPWRGFLMDTARHYYPLDFIMHIIDALGYNKFNVLHWHIVDQQSFPAQSTTYPNLTEAALYPTAIYTHQDIQNVIAYAQTYGIRVIPEFDVPQHTASWFVSNPQLRADCDVTNNIMNPSIPETYEFIDGLFTEMSGVFVDNFFHTGGDEAQLNCWTNNTNINAWMVANNYTMGGAEQYFEDQLDVILGKLGRTKIVWNDPFQNGVVLDKSTLIQVWDSNGLTQQVLNQGYNAIVSFYFYLDRQLPTGNTHYEWQDTWQDFYGADPMNNITQFQSQLWGGEACMWSEQISQSNFDVRVWPRSIAIGERLWSPQYKNNVTEALPRIEAFSCIMAGRSVASGPLQPDYCLHDILSGENQFKHAHSPIMRIPSELLQQIYHKN